jgi:formate--tetrahydrofolate ligase
MSGLLNDLAVARQVDLRFIGDLARDYQFSLSHVEFHGPAKAKIRLEALDAPSPRPRGKYVVVTAITPTPLGEGKTLTTIGLTMGLARLGKRSMCTLRQPSLGPVFGAKGGATGGGRAQVLPAEEINFHLTGDNHAVSTAHNLLSSFVDNHLFHGNALGLDMPTIEWPRTSELNDRALRRVTLDSGRGVVRPSHFVITAASEIMAILALATSYSDMRERLRRIVVGASAGGRPVTAADLRCAGAMAVLLRDALKPNLLQTSEGQACLMHAGPFGNIAHGNSSILADAMALRAADIVVTESGFGADLGYEKFIDIKCRASGLAPDAAVIVATVRGLKLHSGRFEAPVGKPLPPELSREDLPALQQGLGNLRAMIDIVRRSDVTPVVCVNRFSTDTDRELAAVLDEARRQGVDAAVSEAYDRGGAGAESLAAAVWRACERGSAMRPLYPLEAPIREKIETIARDVYGAASVSYSSEAEARIHTYERWGFGKLPICMAKTQLSLSHDPKFKGAPRDFTLPVRQIQLSAGAGFITPLCGDMLTMPGLPSDPQGQAFDIDARGEISEL